MKKLFILLFIAALLLAACASGGQAQKPTPNLTTGSIGSAEDLLPSQAEIDQAKKALDDKPIGIVACTPRIR